MKTKYQFSYYLRIVLTIVIYAIFYYYIIYSCIHAQNKGTIIFNIIMGVMFGSVGTLFEYLRIVYDAATKRLIVDSKPEETLRLLNKVEKADLFKTFKTSCQMMRMLALIDLRRFDEVLDYVKQLEKDSISEYDVQIVAKYAEMMAHGEMGNKGKSNEAFKQLINLRDLRTDKGKRYKGAFYFNWEVVNGQHKNYEKEYDGALRYLKDIDETNMNMRELMHYLLAKTIAAKNSGQSQIYEDCKQRLLKTITNNKAMKDYVDTL